MSLHRELFIKQQWVAAKGPALTSRNPATEEIVWQGQSATEEDVQEAIKASLEAQNTWPFLTLKERTNALLKFKRVLGDALDSLSEAISKETGKPLWESKGEVNAMINKVDISIDAYQNRCAEMTKDLPTGKSITRHKPHGTVAVFGPFNFPGHLPNGHIIPALLAGNTVIFKPSELTPRVGELMMECWEQCGLPPGTINMVQGGRDVGRSIASHPMVDGLFFTGSWGTGRILLEQFAKHPEKILALEMGGNNPLVVTQLNDLTAAAFVTIQSSFLTSGQRCSCSRRLIVVKNSHNEEFIQELARQMEKITVGPYTNVPEPYMGPVISESAASHLLSVQEALKNKGGLVIKKMQLLKPNTALLSPGLMDVTQLPTQIDEEFFGPFLRLIWVEDFASAIKEANNTAFGLTAGLLSTSSEEYELFYKQIRAGVINWNTPLTGASSAAPFGGVKHSGNFRPSAYYAADYCAYPVASLEANEPKLPSQLPPGIDIHV